jgi:hypothetical protein
VGARENMKGEPSPNAQVNIPAVGNSASAAKRRRLEQSNIEKILMDRGSILFIL